MKIVFPFFFCKLSNSTVFFIVKIVLILFTFTKSNIKHVIIINIYLVPTVF